MIGTACVIQNPEYGWLPEPPVVDAAAKKPVPADAWPAVVDARPPLVDLPAPVPDRTAPADLVPVDTRPLCLGGEETYGGACYQVLQGAPMTRGQAAKLCAAQGASLVSIGDAAENAFAYGLLPPTAQTAWIGLKRTGPGRQDFVWDGGGSLGYAAWAPGKPNDENDQEECTLIWGPALTNAALRGRWNDAPCDAPPRDTGLCKRIP